MGEYALGPIQKVPTHTFAHALKLPRTAKPKKLITFDRISPTSEMLLDQLDLPDFDGLLRYLLQLFSHMSFRDYGLDHLCLYSLTIILKNISSIL